MDTPKILIATHPFGQCGEAPLTLLRQSGCKLVFNPYGRRLRAGETASLLAGVQAVIAGTEAYDATVLAAADALRVIARVGIGLDSVDLATCRRRGIEVTYTPDAPSDAVAEFTVGLILNLLRHVHASDHSVRMRAWNRLMGRLVQEVTIGVIGVGRIGSRVIRLLQPFGPTLLATDTDPRVQGARPPAPVTWCDLPTLLARSDLITLHIPLNAGTRHFLDRSRIAAMTTGALVVNTSRGEIVDERALSDALLQHHLGGAALDVFEQEPYEGPLARLDNVILTAHMGASARRSRLRMETEAAQDCLRVLNHTAPDHSALRELEDSP